MPWYRDGTLTIISSKSSIKETGFSRRRHPRKPRLHPLKVETPLQAGVCERRKTESHTQTLGHAEYESHAQSTHIQPCAHSYRWQTESGCGDAHTWMRLSPKAASLCRRCLLFSRRLHPSIVLEAVAEPSRTWFILTRPSRSNFHMTFLPSSDPLCTRGSNVYGY